MVKRRLYDVRVVTIGGGTGSSTLLRGLKLFTEYITAVVTVADDGGSSGMLREELGMLPPGDARNCLFALANAEPAFAQVFDYRFKEGSLKGQSLGNLFVAALNDIYGGFDLGLKEAGNILAITGQVLPMTLEDVKLCARLKNGDIIKGESVLPKEVLRIGSPIETLFLEPEFSHSIPETLQAIEEADLILLGPGSLYTSLIPNLLVEDLAGAIRKSKAKKFYIVNLMTQPGETDGFSVRDHYRVLERYLGEGVVSRIFVNEETADVDMLRHYKEHGAQQPVKMTEEDEVYFAEKKIAVTCGEFMQVDLKYIRHDAKALCQAIFDHYTQIYRG